MLLIFLFLGLSRGAAAAQSVQETEQRLRSLLDKTVGRSLFSTPWTPAPATTTIRDGLGPLFQTHSCRSCHRNGEGAPSPRSSPELMVIRLGHRGSLEADSLYGIQLQTRSVLGLGSAPALGEAQVEIDWIENTAFRLTAPTVRLSDFQLGPPDSATLEDPRHAPGLFGVTRLEEVSEDEIQSAADPDDRDRDGISGRAPEVWSPDLGRSVAGRFGHKAKAGTLLDQIASAFHEDLGITSPLFPAENCTERETVCRSAPTGKAPGDEGEISRAGLEEVKRYLGVFGEPPSTPDAAGESVFRSTGCADCHRLSLALKGGGTIRPLTDLLLHDMGEGLRGAIREGAADEREWRTAPLWGLKKRRTGGAFLHDGRAQTVEEAIRWHGGEAESAKKRFESLHSDSAKKLLDYVKSR